MATPSPPGRLLPDLPALVDAMQKIPEVRVLLARMGYDLSHPDLQVHGVIGEETVPGAILNTRIPINNEQLRFERSPPLERGILLEPWVPLQRRS